uniref:Peptidylglycine alpha-amidating monooxygenase n=1 Tax=Callorhinchus milii TaxID=7868 RepID=A0A4W3KCM4_CALMI|eukprot:gi/632951475/ref/XP_007891314.1/ PREDICTED: peptidyl-glycine alpha-amidating monooxygenase isoform X4 [Callorhinchus milii]
MAGLINKLVLVFLILQNNCMGHESTLSLLKRYRQSAWAYPSDCPRNRHPVISHNSFNLDVRMPGVTPVVSDSYFCMSVPVPFGQKSYIVDFQPHANMDTAHHMLLFGCKLPATNDNYWACGNRYGTCLDEAKIMYAWARNAPPTRLPAGVGFRVGGNSGINYIVLQVHYGDIHAFRDNHKDCSGVTLQMTLVPQPLIAGIYLLMSENTVIPPGAKVVNGDIACPYEEAVIHPFAFRTHTHQLGQVVSGYRIRDGQWTQIGRQSPQLPQAFYPVEKPMDIKYGDTIAARCVFTGKGRTTVTQIGGTSQDEMCNLYIMYYMDAQYAKPYMFCTKDGSPKLFKHIPPEANIPIPVSPDMAMHGHHPGKEAADKSVALQQPKREEEVVLDQASHLEEVIDWPVEELQLGQVSGVALDSKDNLIIFHRGNHVWDENSFDRKHIYQPQGIGPIQQSTIFTVDPVNLKILNAVGRNIFYLPHGISTDKDDNFWVTDVALHQVFKLGSKGEYLLILGQAFQPGSDKDHFCQPTDVAVDPANGNFYVSDGYCNSRIIKYSPDGKFITQWGEESSLSRIPKPGQFFIPHSLVFVPGLRQLCVADRENGRIQCFVAESGEFLREIHHPEFGGRLFAISYTPGNGGRLYAVNGEALVGNSVPVQGFVMNFSTGEILDIFKPAKENFLMPHDIVAADDRTVYIGDVQASRLRKFIPSEKAEHRSVKKAGPGIEVHEIDATETFLEAEIEGKMKAPDVLEKHNRKNILKQASTAVSPVLITLLLVIPVVVLVGIGVFIHWRKGKMYGEDADSKLESIQSSGGILGRFRGKNSRGLNLGNFFASHRGYSRKGFDRLSTEGSDHEKDEEGTDSETEEYSAPPTTSSS